MISDQRTQSKTICVIGAGPSGLIAARELKKEFHKVMVMEQSNEIGGQWLYNADTQNEVPLGQNHTNRVIPQVHSSIYASLRLTSPREIMGYTDFPFVIKKGRDARRFPGHRELYLYLKDFCECFRLRELVRFNTKVEYVGMLNYGCTDQDLKWVVKSRMLGSADSGQVAGVVAEEIFDAVVVATGHYTQPRLPTIKGMDMWKRKQIHSHIYRVPGPFRGQVVVVVGNSLSGQDISMELVDVAKEVHLSSKTLNVTEGLSKVISKYKNLHLHPEVEELFEDGRVIFMDKSFIKADTIIYCTGYSYSFPFLDTQGIITVDDDRVGPLYEHTFPPSLAPSLSFIGIPRKLIGFPFFEAQAKWIAQLLSGKRRLPSYEDMMMSVEEYYKSRDAAGIPKHNTHDIGNFEYCDKYCDQAFFPRLEQWRKDLCVSALINAATNLETYRDSDDDHDDETLQTVLKSSHFSQSGGHNC